MNGWREEFRSIFEGAGDKLCMVGEMKELHKQPWIREIIDECYAQYKNLEFEISIQVYEYRPCIHS